MNDPLRYAGRRVIVTGAATGIGAATAELLVTLGAEVHAIDLEKPQISGLASFTPADLREPTQIEGAVAKIGTVVNALFNCAGFNCAGFNFAGSTGAGARNKVAPLAVMLAEFCGSRAMTEAVIPLMIEGSAVASVASTAGRQWTHNLELLLGLLRTPDFAGARAWCEAHPEALAEDNGLADEAINAYTALRSFDLAPAGIRINCVNTGPTDLVAPPGPVWTLIFLNSPRASSVTGQRLVVDGLGDL